MSDWKTLKKTDRTDKPSSDLRFRQNWMSVYHMQTMQVTSSLSLSERHKCYQTHYIICAKCYVMLCISTVTVQTTSSIWFAQNISCAEESKQTGTVPSWLWTWSYEIIIIQQPGFDLPCQSWSLLNSYRTGQGPCRAILHKWGLAKLPTWLWPAADYEPHRWRVPWTKFDGGLQLLHEAEDDAVKWLESTATTAFANWHEIIIIVINITLKLQVLACWSRDTSLIIWSHLVRSCTEQLSS